VTSNRWMWMWNALHGGSAQRRRGWCDNHWSRSWCRARGRRRHTSRRWLRWGCGCTVSMSRTDAIRLPMCCSSWGRRWWGFLLHCRSSFLCISHKVLDEVHVLSDKVLIHTLTFKLPEEGRPGWIDISGCKTFLGVVTHVGYMSKGT
jgi:hypothetical protein